MKFLKHWKVILATVVVFAAGGVAGSVVTTIVVRRSLEQALKVENWPDAGMKHLEKTVRLTPEQRPRIRSILEEAAHGYKRSFERAFGECATTLVASWRQIDQELTPAQRTLHQADCQKFRDFLRKEHQFELPVD